MVQGRTLFQFPKFALRSSPTSGDVLLFARRPERPLLPLFSDRQWAADFAHRHRLKFVPSVPLNPKTLHALLTTELNSNPSHIVFDLADPVIDATVRQYRMDSFIEKLEALRDAFPSAED